MIMVDNRADKKTEEGRPIIFGQKEELEKLIRESGIPQTGRTGWSEQIRRLNASAIKNRSFWTNDKQLLSALGF